MKANNSSKERPQSVSEALSLIQTAEQKKRPVEVTEAGRIKIIFHRGKMETAAEAKTAVVSALLTKMMTEAKIYEHSGTGISLEKLMESMPGLKKFKETMQTGDLKQQWRAWKCEVEDNKIATEKALLENRKQVIADMSAALPAALVLTNMNGDIATLSHSFSEEAQKGILEDFLNLNLKETDSERGFDPQFVKDAGRADFSFDANGQTIQYPRGDKTEVPKALMQFTDDNPIVAQALSKLINQGTFAPLLVAERVDLPTKSGGPFGVIQGVAEGSKEDSEAVQYKLSKQANRDFIVSCICLKKGVSVTPVGSDQTWPINSGKNWEGPPSQHNFAVRQTITMRLKHAHLEEGVIIPEFIQPPTTSWCISPDFESIDKDFLSAAK